MPTVTFAYRTEQERIAIEAAIAFVGEMHSLAQTAPAPQVLSACEELGLGQGRELLRETLEQALRARIEPAEKKGGTRAAAQDAPPSCASSEAARKVS